MKIKPTSRLLNEAFKQVQRLPEWPLTKSCVTAHVGDICSEKEQAILQARALTGRANGVQAFVE